MTGQKNPRKPIKTAKGKMDYFIYRKMIGLFRVICSKLFIFAGIRNVIVIGSVNDFDMNGGALYDYLIRNGYNKKYKIVWFLKNKLIRSLPDNVCAFEENTFDLVREYYRNTAKYIFYDNVPIKKVKKAQKLIYCGHATRAMKGCKGYVSQPPQVDYVLSASTYNNALMSDIYECPEEKMVVTGFPVTDYLFHSYPSFFPSLTGCKTIVWMPTFRKHKGVSRNDSSACTETGLSLLETLTEYRDLNTFLEKVGVNLIIKFHPQQDMAEIHVSDLSHIKLMSADDMRKDNIETYQFLTQTDALISDYSSISFDYMLLDKPIAYVLSDYKEYKLGFAVENPLEYMPGCYIYNIEDLYQFINDVVKGEDRYKDKRNIIRDKIHTYQDGKSCERVIKFLDI